MNVQDERFERIAMGIVGWIPVFIILLFGIHSVHSLVEAIPLYYELEERTRHATDESRRLEERVHLLRRRTNALTMDPWTIERHLRILFGKTDNEPYARRPEPRHAP